MWLEQGCNIVVEGQRTELAVLKRLALTLARAELAVGSEKGYRSVTTTAVFCPFLGLVLDSLFWAVQRSCLGQQGDRASLSLAAPLPVPLWFDFFVPDASRCSARG